MRCRAYAGLAASISNSALSAPADIGSKSQQLESEKVELALLNRSVGWCPIAINGECAPLGSFWHEEEL
ncbi:hypothetical protein NXC24_PB00390 (plasmid) [Rhizobium sp. NXC24]|nr:hypothetical protein NXC24_PB00390 [Rhizobium sp. NXC24]